MQKDTFRKIGRETHKTIDRDYFLNALIGLGTYWHKKGSYYYIGELDLKIHEFELSLGVSKTVYRTEEVQIICHFSFRLMLIFFGFGA